MNEESHNIQPSFILKFLGAKDLNLKSKDFKFCVELPIKAKRKGYKLANSKAYERSRIGGKKKVNAFKDGFLILLAMVRLFFNK